MMHSASACGYPLVRVASLRYQCWSALDRLVSKDVEPSYRHPEEMGHERLAEKYDLGLDLEDVA